MAAEVARRVGRPRGFDVTEVLDDSVDVFWELGYEATTTRDLERRLAISQSSLYNTFGSKKELLLASIDRYEERIRDELFPILHEGGGGTAAVEAFIAALGKWIADNGHRGCLVVNLMASVDDPEIAERATTYRETIRKALYAAIRSESGVDGRTATTRADALLAGVLGLHVTARSSDDPSEVEAMVRGLRAQMRAWS